MQTKNQYKSDADTCDNKIECVRLQEVEDGSNYPIGYWSTTSIEKKQMLATAHKNFRAVI